MSEWNDFFVATAGASAALTGLIFVGVSINMSDILPYKQLADRALQSLVMLLVILVTSVVLLMPDQSATCIGVELLVIGIIISAISIYTDWSIYKETPAKYKKFYLRNMVLTQLASLSYATAGIVFLQNPQAGVRILAWGIVISFLKSVIDAWVLLVEIKR